MKNTTKINIVLCLINAALSLVLAIRYKRWIHYPIALCDIILAVLHIQRASEAALEGNEEF